MDWKERVTTMSEKIFPGISQKPKIQYENEVLSSLPLQMALYFNVVYFPFWCFVLVYFLVEKYSCYSELYKFITISLLIATFFIEILRLVMGYDGNLRDKVPELAGFWMLSLLLQLPLQSIFLLNPYFNLHIIEIVCQVIELSMLLIQIIFGYRALKNTAKIQATYNRIMKLGYCERKTRSH